MSSIQPTASTAADTSHGTRASDTAVRDAVAAANARFMAAFRDGDADAVAACYTPDAQLLPAGSDVVAGTQAIAAFWRGAMTMGIAGVRLASSEVETAGDVAVEVGRYSLAGADGGSLDDGKYLVVWRRDGADWKLHRDIWTTSRPAAGGG